MLNTLQTGTPISVAGITMIPIERVEIMSGIQSCACWLSAKKEVLAIVVCENGGTRVMDIDSRDRTLDEYKAEISQLVTLISATSPQH